MSVTILRPSYCLKLIFVLILKRNNLTSCFSFVQIVRFPRGPIRVKTILSFWFFGFSTANVRFMDRCIHKGRANERLSVRNFTKIVFYVIDFHAILLGVNTRKKWLENATIVGTRPVRVGSNAINIMYR